MIVLSKLIQSVCINAFLLCVFYLAGRYFVTSSTGDLYIRSVKADDNLKKFACQTTNRITRERKISEPVHLSIKGRQFTHSIHISLLFSPPHSSTSRFFQRNNFISYQWYNTIAEVTTNMAPTTNQKPVLNMYVDHGNDIHLPCNIQGNPLPFYA